MPQSKVMFIGSILKGEAFISRKNALESCELGFTKIHHHHHHTTTEQSIKLVGN